MNSRQVFIHHGDVGVNETFDEGGGEAIAFHINAGFVADFTIGVVEFKVADRHVVVGKGEELGDRIFLVCGGGDGTKGVEDELLLFFSGFGIAEPFAVVALECHLENGFALEFGKLPVVVGEELQEGGENAIGGIELGDCVEAGVGEVVEEVADFSEEVGDRGGIEGFPEGGVAD